MSPAGSRGSGAGRRRWVEDVDIDRDVERRLPHAFNATDDVGDRPLLEIHGLYHPESEACVVDKITSE